jgi:hypothetical protein
MAHGREEAGFGPIRRLGRTLGILKFGLRMSLGGDIPETPDPAVLRP